MSNLYGYSDYHGPGGRSLTPTAPAPSSSIVSGDNPVNEIMKDPNDNEDEEKHNPLQAAFWMEGDSLAPPCGTSIATIHAILQFAHIASDDVVYDLGCGDGRMCLEAYHVYHCQTVGVEVEADLVERANYLVSQLSSFDALHNRPRILHTDLRNVLEDLLAMTALEGKDTTLPLPIPTVILLYLLPESLKELECQFQSLLKSIPHLRIVCNTWGLPSLQAVQKECLKQDNGAVTDIFLYTRDSLL
jgi:SAM-dependent methyltransferase